MQCASPSRTMIARMTYETHLCHACDIHTWTCSIFDLTYTYSRMHKHTYFAFITVLMHTQFFSWYNLCSIIFVHKNKATYRTNQRSIMRIIIYDTAIIVRWNKIWFHRMKQYKRPLGTSVLRPGGTNVWGLKLPGSEALGGMRMRPSASKSRATPITSRPRNLFIYEK
jgi:hypothetical protein